MRTLLVIAPKPALAAAVRAALDPARYRVLEQSDLHKDQLLLTASSIDACIVDVELTTVEPIRTIERLRNLLPNCPMILYAAVSQWEWEEDAYMLGVNHILAKPVRARLLNSLLDQVFAAKTALEQQMPAVMTTRVETRPAVEPGAIPVRMLKLLRDYSSILSHSLCADSLLKEFLLLLREIIGVNRAVVFLRPAPGSLDDSPEVAGALRLKSACAIGLAQGMLEHFELSLESGIGRQVFRSGRIVRRDSAEVERDPQMQKEFELLSTQVAVPVLDRESLVGVAVFDGRVTGEPMTSEELALIFHLLEQLGMAIKNIWMHDQVAAHHEMMADILGHLSSGCVVVGRNLAVLHANEMARICFPNPARPAGSFDFADLPQSVGSKVFEVLKTGRTISGYKFHPAEQPERHYQITITPFQKQASIQPSAALLVIEDFTQVDRVKQLEIETANLRLVQQMAERLAHEIGNAVVPISTHQQLLDERIDDPEFQQSLADALDEGVKRVTRLVNQMRFLARDRVDIAEPVDVKQLIEEAFREARTYHPATTVLLQYESSGEPLTIACDRVGLQHAFAEIILNALQANTQSCQVQVRARAETEGANERWVQIDVQDSGAGFSSEAAGKAQEPFFTTRNVGLGLGLAVTNKIIQTHCGRMEIPPPRPGQSGLVRIWLPLDSVAAPGATPAEKPVAN